jgi:hypothetical protein
MTETREFPVEVIASISTGTLMCNTFSAVHEASEHLMGHPIWTHHFADKDLWKAMQAAVLHQHPSMPTEAIGVTPENVAGKVTALRAEFGASLPLERGNGETAKSPLDGIPEGKPTIILGRKS